MWSREFDTNTHDNGQYLYKNADHPKHIDFTIDEVVYMSHDAGTAGTHWALSIEKDVDLTASIENSLLKKLTVKFLTSNKLSELCSIDLISHFKKNRSSLEGRK